MQPQTHSSRECGELHSAGRMKRVACLLNKRIKRKLVLKHLHNCLIFFFYLYLFRRADCYLCLERPSTRVSTAPVECVASSLWKAWTHFCFCPEKSVRLFKDALSNPIKVPVPPVKGCIIGIPSCEPVNQIWKSNLSFPHSSLIIRLGVRGLPWPWK